MSIQPITSWLVKSWDANAMSIVERCFTQEQMDQLMTLMGTSTGMILDLSGPDDPDLLSFIMYLYYGAVYYESESDRFTYSVDSIDSTTTDTTEDLPELVTDVLKEVGSKLSPTTFSKLALAVPQLRNLPAAYRYADVFPGTAAMRAITESFKTTDYYKWVPVIKKALLPRFFGDTNRIHNVWLREINPVTSVVMATNCGSWSGAWLSDAQRELLMYPRDPSDITCFDTIITADTVVPDSIEEIGSYDALMLSSTEDKRAAISAEQDGQVRTILNTPYTGDAFKFCLTVADTFDNGENVLDELTDVLPLDNNISLILPRYGQPLATRPVNLEDGRKPFREECFYLYDSNLLQQQVFGDPAFTRAVLQEPQRPILHTLAKTRYYDFSAMDDEVLLKWAQWLREYHRH